MADDPVVLTEADDPTEPTEPGCPADDCLYAARTWQDIIPYDGWGPGKLLADVGPVRLLSIPHEPEFKRLKVNIKVKADGAQANGVYFRLCLCRRIDLFPDAFLRVKDVMPHGDPGTWEENVARIARSVSTSWRYYGRVEVWMPSEDRRVGYLNGPVSPAWDWIEDGS